MEEYWRHNTIVEFELQLPEVVAEPPPEVTGPLLAIVSETLSNIVRHSRATRASVELAAQGDGRTWQLTIEDNGTA